MAMKATVVLPLVVDVKHFVCYTFLRIYFPTIDDNVVLLFFLEVVVSSFPIFLFHG